MRKLSLTGTLCLWLILTGLASAHPSENYQASDPPEGYGPGSGYPVEYNFGELTFTQDFPDPSTLTEAEKYIIAGASSGSESIKAWSNEIYMLMLAYYTQTGEVPPTITPAMMQKVSSDGAVNEFLLETLKSPITGEYPRTDAATFERGQVYCRFLTDAEMQHIAGVSDGLRSLWYGEQWINPKTNQLEPLKVRTRPMLVRIYGESGVIYERLQTLFVGQH